MDLLERKHDITKETVVTSVHTGLKLGMSTNLVFGYNSDWEPGKVNKSGIYQLSKNPFEETEIAVSPGPAKWSYPEITLHESVETLLTRIVNYKTNDPADNLKAVNLPAGPLLVGDKDKAEALTALSKTIGVDLNNPEYKYALVQIKNEQGEANHSVSESGILLHSNVAKPPKEWGVSREFIASMSKLPKGNDVSGYYSPEAVSPNDANEYLSFLKKFGSHFISRAKVGGEIFQVFAYKNDAFESIKKVFSEGGSKLSGPDAIAFNYFTTNGKTGRFGFVQEYGKILSKSADPELSSTLKAKDWYDPMWAQGNSIFSVFESNSKISLKYLNEKFLTLGVLEANFTTVGLFFEFNRKRALTRIFKAAMVQKHQNKFDIEYVQYNHAEVGRQIPQSQFPGEVSTIATPSINMYNSLIDLGAMEFVAAEEVKEFTLFTNFLQHASSIKQELAIPGDDVLIAAQVVETEKDKEAPTIHLRNSAYDNYMLTCHSFYGPLIISNADKSNHHTYMDGISYEFKEETVNGRYDILAVNDVKQIPKGLDLKRISTSLEFSFTFSEAMINRQNEFSIEVQRFTRNSLYWITKIIPKTSKDVSLLDLRLRSLDLAHMVENPSFGTFVPILPAKDYEKQIESLLSYVNAINTQISEYQNQIDFRKTQELIFDVGKTLNENIIASGELLVKVIEANAEQERSLSDYYDSIISQKQLEYQQLDKKIGALRVSVDAQQANVDSAVANFKQAVKDWQKLEWVKFGLEVISNVFDASTAVAIPAKAISSVASLGLSIQRIKKLLEILNSTAKVFTDAKTKLDSIQSAQKSLDGLGEINISDNLAWDELNINLTAVLATTPLDPSVKPAKAELQQQFSLLILRGKALMNAKSTAHQLSREVYNNQRQQIMIKENAKRLEALKGNLNPKNIKDLDRNKIDLIGLTGSLVFVRNQMLGMLSKSYTMLDQALQYQYLKPPTPISNYTLIGFRGAIAKQQSDLVAAKSELNKIQKVKTTPIPVQLNNIKVEDLINGEIYKFSIGAEYISFYPYVNMRVESIVAQINGIESTESGKYLLNLAFNGYPFMDRGTHRQLISFYTPGRERAYEYASETNERLFSDDGKSWSEEVSPVTPFSEWELSLPKTSLNKGISFSGNTVDITLYFVLNTRINDQYDILKKLKAHNLKLDAFYRGQAQTLFTPPPITQLVQTMYNQGSALNGWDVVFNMSMSNINEVLKEQYEAFKKNDQEFGGKIDIETKTEVIKGVYSIQRFKIEYGYPGLTFEDNSDTGVKLEMQITGGTLTKCLKNGDEPEKCDPPIELTGETLTAYVPISQIAGLVNKSKDILSVALDFSKGSFTANNIQMSDAERVAFNKAIVAYFVNHPIRFIINSLDLKNIATLEDLKPHQFIFKTLKTPSGANILQLFIQTGSRELLNSSQAFLNNVPEPIPINQDVSLMINSRILFKSVLPASMNKQGWTLTGTDPQDQNKAWSGTFTKASINGNVDLSGISSTSSRTLSRTVRATTKTSYYIPGGNNVTWPINGMSMNRGSDGKLNIRYSDTNIFNFTRMACTQTCILSSCGDWECEHTPMSTAFKFELAAILPLSVSGTGRDQSVKLGVSAKGVGLNARTSGGGPSGCDDLEAQVNSRLKQQVPSQITNQMNITFGAVSVFALQNLLFPVKNYIQLAEAYAPGDLLMVGKFVKDKEGKVMEAIYKSK